MAKHAFGDSGLATLVNQLKTFTKDLFTKKNIVDTLGYEPHKKVEVECGAIIGDGITKDFEFTHTLNSKTVFVLLFDESKTLCFPTVTYESDNELTVHFAIAPAEGVKYIVNIYDHVIGMTI